MAEASRRIRGRFWARTALREERIEFAPRGFFEVGRRNLGGKNRSVNFSARASFRPQSDTFEEPTDGGYGLNEYRVLDLPGAAGVRAGRRRLRRRVRRAGDPDNVQLPTGWAGTPTPHACCRPVFGSTDAIAGRTRLFDERIPPEDELPIDRLFPQVRLSSFAGAIFRDTRDDILNPRRGSTQGLDAELAARLSARARVR